MMINQNFYDLHLSFEEFSNYREVEYSVSSCDNNRETKMSSVGDTVAVKKGNSVVEKTKGYVSIDLLNLASLHLLILVKTKI